MIPTRARPRLPRLAAAAVSLALTATFAYGAGPASADSTTHTIAYTGDFASVFPNPDRGFHNRYEIINDPDVNQYVTSSSPAGSFDPDQVDRTFARAKAAGDTLIHSYVHLDMYQNGPLPQELLDNLSSGLAAIRAAGLKIVLRFAYAWDSTPTVSESQIEAHIAQLAPVLNANADVIDHFEAGFLGEWGEWHDSPYTDSFSQSEADARYRIMKTELDDFPASVPIAIRYPIFNYELQQRSTPPPGCSEPDNCMITQAQFDRLGFHDDCFLADSADEGTYDQNSWLGWYDATTKKQWVYDTKTSFGGEQEVGGETCDSAGDDDAAGVNAQYEMANQHWSEINEDYAPVNIDLWKAANLPASGNDPAETLFTRAQRKLGYRLRLTDATLSNSGTAGSAFTFSAHLSNDGYAAVIQQRPVYLVFDNGTDRYNVPLSALDPRTWLPGSTSVPVQAVTLPSNMAAGTYTVALWLPDQFPDLWSNPAYDIRLANAGTWNATTGYNVLVTGVHVGACSGDCTAPSTPAGLSAPSHTSSSISLSWTASTDNTAVADYQVFRDGTQVATTTGTSFTDAHLTAGTGHSYTVAAVDANGNVSAASTALTASTAAATDTVPPGVPGLLSASAVTATTVGLSWNPSTDDTAVTGYRIYANGAQVGTAGASATGYTATGLSSGTAYTFTVRAFDAAGNLSNEAVAKATTIGSSGGDTTAPSVPSGLSSPSQTASSVNLSWSASTDNVGVTGYDVYRNGAKVGTSTSTSFTDSGLTASTSYTYTVDAFDAAGNVSAKSPALTVSTTSSAGSATVYEADASVNTLAGGAVVASCSACLDGNKVGYVGNGGTLTFNDVSASSAGSKTLTVYYIDGDAGRTGVVTVNGVSTSVSFHGTNDGNWNLVQSLTLTVTLDAGSTNTIEISNPSGWAADIDHITV